MTTKCQSVAVGRQLAALLEPRLRRPEGFEKIVAASEPMLEAFRLTERVARTESTVLLLGESGTGKELFAEAIHRISPRRNGPLTTVNMAAVPDCLVESELFGHVKGAFTHATCSRAGMFEAARSGTVFIDEIGDLRLESQAKLLRVLENRTIHPIGTNETRHVDVRVIAATNRNLEEMVARGDFREDLYYRLHVVAIRLPPLRCRRGDILLLVRHYLRELAAEHGRPELEVDSELLRFLEGYDWPGNVRQLRNAVESMVVLAQRPILTMQDLPSDLRVRSEGRLAETVLPRHATLEQLERMAIVQRVRACDGNRTRAARSLGISVRTLQRKLQSWEMAPRE